MSSFKNFARNTSFLLVSRLIGTILAFFCSIFIVRYLGPTEFGVIAFAISFTGIWGVLSDLGFSVLTTRDLARNLFEKRLYVGNVLLICIIMALITFLLIAIVINLLNYPKETVTVVYIMALYVILTSFTNIFYSIFRANEKMEYQSLGEILNNFLLFLGILVGIALDLNVVLLSLVYIFSSFLTLAYSCLISCWKFFIPEIKTKFSLWKHIFFNALPFGLTSVSGVIYTFIDSVLLSLMKDQFTVGIYSAAYRLTLALVTLPLVINLSIFPIMSKIYVDNNPDITLKAVVKEYFNIMVILAIPMGIGVTLLADKIILVLYGNQYTDSIIALQILIWSIVLIFANSAFVRLLESSDRQLIMTKITIFSMIGNIILNILLIPQFSYIGASVATVFTELTIFTLVFIITYREVYDNFLKDVGSFLGKIIVSSLIMAIFIAIFKDINLFLLIVIAIALYTTLLYILDVNREYTKLFLSHLQNEIKKMT